MFLVVCLEQSTEPCISPSKVVNLRSLQKREGIEIRLQKSQFCSRSYLASRKYPAVFLKLASDVTLDNMISDTSQPTAVP